jgi:hypothetical protein
MNRPDQDDDSKRGEEKAWSGGFKRYYKVFQIKSALARDVRYFSHEQPVSHVAKSHPGSDAAKFVEAKAK